MPIGSLIDSLFGGDNSDQGQVEVAQQQQGVVQGNQLGQYDYVIRNEGDMVFHEYVGGGIQQQYIPVPPPQQNQNIEEGIQILGNDFAIEGLEFTEIVVPESTYIKLRERIPMRAMYHFIAFNGALAPVEAPRDLIINTAMGPVKIINEADRKANFNLEKYMEVVENDII